jgi:hypothetical protein
MREIREAVADLRALRRNVAKRRSFKPLTDREIKDAVEAGRP